MIEKRNKKARLAAGFWKNRNKTIYSTGFPSASIL